MSNTTRKKIYDDLKRLPGGPMKPREEEPQVCPECWGLGTDMNGEECPLCMGEGEIYE